jgi:hypothetical protein
MVVNNGTQLAKEEAQQSSGGNIANAVFHVFLKVALYGAHQLFACFFGQFNGHSNLLRWGYWMHKRNGTGIESNIAQAAIKK